MTLPIAHAGVEITAIAGDVTERVFGFDGAPRLADDDGKLALEIQTIRNLGPDDRLFMADLRIGETGEIAG